MAPTHVDFYFDYLSGYAYFAWLKIQEICDRKGATLGVHPVLFAGLLNHWGQLGPAEIPPKREWVYRDGYRLAKLRGVPLAPPKYHPFNPLLALRLSLAEVGGEDQRGVVDAIWKGGWGAGIDLGSAEELGATLDRAGFDGRALVAKASEPAAKEALKKSTADAIGRGVFGIPTMIVGGELIWGADRTDFVELILDGRDPIDDAWVREVLARPKQADRREALAADKAKG
jgi:2-hydroxychromene-2-carboxylate isomerase